MSNIVDDKYRQACYNPSLPPEKIETPRKYVTWGMFFNNYDVGTL